MSKIQEDPSVYNGHFEVDLIIDRPVAAVWKQFVDIGSWVTSHQIENVYGTPGTEGSITRVTWHAAREHGLPAAHYHYCKIMKLVPEHQYALKTYAEQGGSYGMEITAFDDTRFVDLKEKTKIIFNFYVEIISEAVAKDPASTNLDDSKAGMLSNLNNLKRLVEAK